MADLIIRREGATGFIVFSNPSKRNALTYDMWKRVPEAVAQLERDGDVRIIVVRGDGDTAFAAGADISEFDRMRDSGGATASYNEAVDDANASLFICSKPTLASIRGPCIGGGLEIAAHCDVRFCADDAIFSLPAARLGMGYAYASIVRIEQLIGPAYCAEMVFCGLRYSAQEALHMRLVNRVLVESYKDRTERDMRTVRTMIDNCFSSDDYREGRRAYQEKRKPVFRGR